LRGIKVEVRSQEWDSILDVPVIQERDCLPDRACCLGSDFRDGFRIRTAVIRNWCNSCFRLHLLTHNGLPIILLLEGVRQLVRNQPASFRGLGCILARSKVDFMSQSKGVGMEHLSRDLRRPVDMNAHVRE
jgi:hypothetical protein